MIGSERDNDLIKAVAKGNREAFRQLYGSYSDKVYNTALSYSKSVEDAEEITQDVFMKIFKKADGFKTKSSVSTWIYRITVNSAINHVKRKKRFSFIQFGKEIEAPEFEHPAVKLENQENAKALFQVIDSLPFNQRTAFILSYVEELPRQQVAEVMELSLKAVESLLQRAKQSLRKMLEEHFPDRRKSNKPMSNNRNNE